MTVAIVVTMFVLILLADYLVAKSRKPVTVNKQPVQVWSAPRLEPAVVGGLRVAENLKYHPGHTWALSESPQKVRVGIDDLAGHLFGKIDGIKTPAAGSWVRQGQPVLTFNREGREAKLVSPVEGVITAINPALKEDPDLARRDPYGEGWLFTVDAPDAKTSFRNLLGGTMALRWMEDATAKLRAMMPTGSYALAQDGGLMVDDLTPLIADWDAAKKEFFLD
jgi:glycine cleavage system H lipoate-binding protein